MNKIVKMGLCVATLATGCADGARDTSGRLDLTGLGRRAATLVATDSAGAESSVAVESDGAFRIVLPVDRSYAIAFRDPASQRVFANLVFEDAQKSTVKIIAGDSVDIGEVRSVRARHLENGEAVEVEDEDCRGVGNTPEPTVDTPPMIDVSTSFLVAGDLDLVGENAPDDTVHTDDSLVDGDGDLRPDCHDDDRDDDGVCDDDDDDQGDGDDESDDDNDDHGGARADLPYAVQLDVGAMFKLSDAFEGAAPAAIVGVEMEGSTWRLTELENDTPFTVTQADCDHEGNRDTGRDRVFVSWQNADGSVEIDHLDLRYCD